MHLQLENVIFLYCGNFYHVVGVETVTILILFLAVFSSMNPKAEEILKHHPAHRQHQFQAQLRLIHMKFRYSYLFGFFVFYGFVLFLFLFLQKLPSEESYSLTNLYKVFFADKTKPYKCHFISLQLILILYLEKNKIKCGLFFFKSRLYYKKNTLGFTPTEMQHLITLCLSSYIQRIQNIYSDQCSVLNHESVKKELFLYTENSPNLNDSIST